MVEAHEVDILVKDALEEALDILDLERELVVTLKVRVDARDACALVLRRLRSTAAIGVALTTAADCGAALDDLCPAVLSLATPDVLMVVLVDQQLGAADTNTPENAENLGEELDKVNRARKTIVAKMARAVVIRMPAGAAELSIIKYTHARVKETADFGFTAFISHLRRDFHNGAPLNLLGREDPELNPNNGFNL